MVLDTAKGEKTQPQNGPDTREYEVYDLNQHIGEGDEWDGQPYLTKIFPSADYDDAGLLYISNHDNQEKLRARVKVKNADSKEHTFREGSVGFDLIRTFKELDGEIVGDITQFTIPYEDLQEYINSLDKITVKAVPHTSEDKDGKEIYWKTLEVIKIGE